MSDDFDLEKRLGNVHGELGEFLMDICKYHEKNKRTPHYPYKNDYKTYISKFAKKILESRPDK